MWPDVYDQALCKLGKNGTILKMNGDPYAVVDRGGRSPYLQVHVRLKEGGRSTFQVKCLVLFLLGIPFNSVTHHVSHKDGNYRNCSPENLEVRRRNQPKKRMGRRPS